MPVVEIAFFEAPSPTYFSQRKFEGVFKVSVNSTCYAGPGNDLENQRFNQSMLKAGAASG
jgi:hypothetical protein